MANGDFRQDLNPTSDPNYLRQSKEPDRIRPLEQVSVPANTIADTRFGSLLQGIGNVAELGFSLVDNTIKRNIVDTAHSLVDPIQSSHGSDLSASDVQPIAGTGAKGKARIQAASQYNLFGSPDGGAGSSSYAPSDAARDYAGLPAEITQSKPLPQGAEIELNRVSRMNEAYVNGTMSDSYYNAQLVATTKELRARYPGYRDEVDAAVSQITGVQPANALRKSLLSDLNANAAARASGMSDQEKLLQKNATSITEIVPNFFSNRNLYAGKETAILTSAYQLDAERARVTAATQRLTLDTTNAGQVATDASVNVVRAGVAKMNSWVDPSDGKTINQKLNDMSKDGGTPEQIAGVVNTLENMKRQLTQGINSELTDVSRGAGGKTLAAIAGRDKTKAAGEQALEPIDAAIAQARAGNIPMLKTILDRFDMTKTQEAQRQMEQNPAVKYIAGLDKAGGQAFIGQVFQGTQLLPAFQKGLTEDKIFQTAVAGKNGTPVPGLTTQIADMQKAGVKVDGPVLKAIVQGNMAMMNADKLGPEVNAAAVKNLYDPKFFAGLEEREQMQTFQWMSKPENTARIVELDKQSPGLLNQYTAWSKYAASVVVSRGISAARDAAEDPRFDIEFNPKTLQIDMKPKPGMFNKIGIGETNIGAAYVRDVNQTLRILAPIFKAQGGDPVESVKTWINDMQIKTESVNGATNPLLKRVGETIHDMFLGPKEVVTPKKGDSPEQNRGVIKGNLSDEVLLGIKTTTTPIDGGVFPPLPGVGGKPSETILDKFK